MDTVCCNFEFFQLSFHFYLVTSTCLWSGQVKPQKKHYARVRKKIMFWLIWFCLWKLPRLLVKDSSFFGSKLSRLLVLPLPQLENVQISR